MKYFILGLLMLCIGSGWAQDQDLDREHAIHVQGNGVNSGNQIDTAQKDKTITPADGKLQIVPAPGKPKSLPKREVMGSASTSGAPLIKQPLANKVNPDRQAIKQKFAGARKIKFSDYK